MKNRKQKPTQSQNRTQDNQIFVHGKHPALTVLKQRRRKIFSILVTTNFLSELENFLKTNSLSSLRQMVRVVSDQEIEVLIGKNQTHQGIVVKCSKLAVKTQNDLLEELYALKEKNEKLPTLLFLDQLSDPHNVGAIIRSAVAFGVTKIIFSEHNSVKESAVMVKSSAGMIDFADLIEVTNFSTLMEKLKKIDYWCFGLDGSASETIAKIKSYDNVVLIVGSEGYGIRNLVKKNCDLLVKIDIDPRVESLNASVATSITLHELYARK
jgi:23S rRNA (guanosine2251-2'-O)-methyltransferase